VLRTAEARGPALPLGPVRGMVLAVFALFAGLHWMGMLAPAGWSRAWEAVGIVVLIVPALLLAARLPHVWSQVAAAAVAVAAVALALLAGGIGDEYLRPDLWGDLLAGVGRGIDSLPGVRVPYSGLDEWVIAVIGMGGTLLLVVAALLAFWPRRGRTGFPYAALLVLVTVYAVPAIVLDFEGEFIRGAALALLVVAFLRLERLGVRDAPAAAVGALVAALVALAAAPLLDGRQPWWDYESWAVETASDRAVTFSWNHDYSPLDWPRDGRELLRVKADIPAYWKAVDLDVFDGLTWRQDPRQRGEDPTTQLPDVFTSRERWSQTIEVKLRNLRTDTFVGAGITSAVRGKGGYPIGGGVFNAVDELGRGDGYVADVYTPRPTDRQLRTAGNSYEDWLRGYLSLFVPAGPGVDSSVELDLDRVEWPAWGSRVGPRIEQLGAGPERAGPVLRRSSLARSWALAKELKAEAETPFDYVQAVEGYLDSGFAYSEQPPRGSESLDGFLFDTKIGFCQQFSGAEALLLRMGGIPARVATGFSTGSFDEKQKEYVVRDLDAHSWVEVWFPSYGWVTRDPTPAAAPARSQPGDDDSELPSAGTQTAPDLGGERLSDLESNRALAEGGGVSTGTWIAFGIASALIMAAAVALQLRSNRRRPPPDKRPMADFQRALERAGVDGYHGVTLTGLERRFSGWPGAAGYVRALRDARYSGRAAAPTRDQRRGLRAALARDAGVLRSWWALPPRRDG
jgi:transglutaminase-like putative cysteine protease